MIVEFVIDYIDE
ncbi:Protein of unknown function [Bacillus thuringiensis]|uniref:Uncharacterized protein n=2 Tax=Bacillus cereus group TaxID=86661 RepID=A0A1C4AAM6_BACTU|nr:Protein of unknown function [Bacillus wiedmannii]SCB91662.1 Protein of unknown function [Bacillus thuringiensis]SCM91278.1 Protein of unknown function [Bacillus cereus]SCL84831.1 Protein of unknown function [Bacillus wiedmannii]SCN01193.1 Protein of unknown function [Bacillus wiedmannii]